MKTIEALLRQEICELENIIMQAQIRMQTAPKGRISIKKKKHKKAAEYYYVETDSQNPNGRYLNKNDRILVYRIVQRDYDIKVIKNAHKRKAAIQTFLDTYKKTDLKEIYDSIHLCRRELLCNPLLPDDEFIKRWQETEYTGKRFDEDVAEIFTDRGERVRSKSEKIIADKLYSLGIPYRYEYPLVLSGNIKLYPDFTILKMPEREEVYLEHFGMMDNDNYAETVMYKLGTYEKNGIFLGKNLFMTYETSKNPLNTRILDSFLKELFREV